MPITVGCTKEFLDKSYQQVENLRLQILDELYRVQKEMEHWGVLPEAERTVLAKAGYDGRVLQITVNDVLPRYAAGIKNSLLRVAWCQSIIEAVNHLRDSQGVDPRFERALACVTVFHRLDTRWDIDNRAIKYLVNGLACAGVVSDDSWQNLAVLVIGKYDKKHPRTEIVVCPWHHNVEDLVQFASTRSAAE
ncbi:hypothetical protein Daud_0813 [Candidatus Desulforudis audaxviator MP104C]|uniref:Uncharacterized protein n=1 Tax=Desulforudis audaxviator (strain MP104C) TaxID=477974 RepID=B1I2Y2_DESAP|nr:hypothetical protein [Candidatus Desulforudis audaxviator]ACA59328.1 hypothetical protein Daud_0813 [Candidatus Desulforudis audaxviator MP104C]